MRNIWMRVKIDAVLVFTKNGFFLDFFLLWKAFIHKIRVFKNSIILIEKSWQVGAVRPSLRPKILFIQRDDTGKAQRTINYVYLRNRFMFDFDETSRKNNYFMNKNTNLFMKHENHLVEIWFLYLKTNGSLLIFDATRKP